MTSPWLDKLDKAIADGGGEILVQARQELTGLVGQLLDDEDPFLKEMGRKLESKLDGVASGDIEQADFDDYLADVNALLRMNETLYTVRVKTIVQNTIDRVADLAAGTLKTALFG